MCALFFKIIFGMLLLNRILIAQIYDQWVESDSLEFPRQFHTSVKLNNGKIMVIGGTPDDNRFHGINECEVYNPVTDQWETIAPMNFRRAFHSSIKLEDGRVFVCGGYNPPDVSSYNMLNNCEIYSPNNDTWIEVDSMSYRRVEPELVRLLDGRILIIGGRTMYGLGPTAEEDATETCEIFDPSTGEIEMATSLNLARTGHSATLLPDGNVIVVGGNYWGGPPGKTCEVFNYISEEWNYVASMNVGRNFSMTYQISDNKFLVVGGSEQSFEEYDYLWDTWSIVDTSVNLLLGLDKSVSMLDGRIFFTVHNDSLCKIFNPYSRHWASAGSLPYKQTYGTLNTLIDGRILLAGIKGNSSIANKSFLFYPDTTTSVEKNSSLINFRLFQNYPNPFNPVTTIKYIITKSGFVSLKIFDLQGEEVIELVNKYQIAGEYEFRLDASNLSSGIYIYKLQSDDYEQSKKMLLIK